MQGGKRSSARLRRRGNVAWRRIRRSFYFSWVGLVYLFRTERNARMELAIAVIVCAAAVWLRVSATQWAILALTIVMVLVLEGLNTAIEAVVDLASPRVHPLAKIAKDVAAGMVLIGAIGAVVVGLLVLGPPLMAKLSW